MQQEPCPICATPTKNLVIDHGNLTYRVDCLRCGAYSIQRKAFDDLMAISRDWDPDTWRMRLSYAVRRMQEGNARPHLTTEVLRHAYDAYPLPTPPEQGDNLLLAICDDVKGQPGTYSTSKDDALPGLIAKVGAVDIADIHYITGQLERMGLVDDSSAQGLVSARPTFAGWQRYRELQQQAVESRVAFMAMPFGDAQLDSVYTECYRPAVAATGFTLRRIDENAPTGSIINRMRVEIRRARFMVCELTEDNEDAYWEAGFAEGLERPVVYTCRHDYKPHFDTSQLLTVFWDPDKLDAAAEDLKNTIRATLPADAKIDDDED